MLNSVALVILDGWGYRSESSGNAILQARTPQMDYLTENYPWCLLDAAGEAVGLPAGQMGNSEAVSYTHLDVYKRQAQGW